jgi:hypothetical protein
MATDGLSGKDGTAYKDSSEITGIEIVGWKLEPKTNTPKHCTNATNGIKVPLAGVRECSGSMDVKLKKNGFLPFQDGDTVSLKLYVDDSSYWTVSAIIASTPVEVDIDGGEWVGGTFNFEVSSWSGTGCVGVSSSSGA